MSYDVDIFLVNADAVTALSPNQNPATKALLAGRKYEFPGNYLKLKLDHGEIDFILGGRRTTDPTQEWSFGNTIIRIETPWEIAIKKLFYRPSTFKVRDIFDMAAVIDRDGEKLRQFSSVVADRLDKAADRVSAMIPTYEDRVSDDVNFTKNGQRYATRDAAEIRICDVSALDRGSAARRLSQASGAPRVRFFTGRCSRRRLQPCPIDVPPLFPRLRCIQSSCE